MKQKRNHDRAVDKVGFSIAMPISLADKLQEIAKKETRTRNGQIVHFLTIAVAEYNQTAAIPFEKEPPLQAVAEEQSNYGTTDDVTAALDAELASRDALAIDHKKESAAPAKDNVLKNQQ